MASTTSFTAMVDKGNWMLDKSGTRGKFEATTNKVSLQKSQRSYTTDLQSVEEDSPESPADRLVEGLYNRIRSKGFDYLREGKFFQSSSAVAPATLPVVRLDIEDMDMTMELDYSGPDPSFPRRSLDELRVQIPPESFDIEKIVCGTYIDARLLVLRGVSGAALFFVRSAAS